MINRIVHFALHQRVLVLIGAAVILAWGVWSFLQLPIEAYPDVMNTEVQVITQWPGHAAEEVEKLITVPLETSLNGVPHVQSLRSRSLFGLSVVYLEFEDGVDDYFARQQVMERMAAADIPSSVQPTLSPLASATGEIMRYTITGAPLMQLRTLEDWTLERTFKSIPGVADVASFGGLVKQYQVLIDPGRLKAYDVTLKNVTDAISGANANAGGSYIERGSEEYVVRGVGLLRGVDDIGNVVVTSRSGTPLHVRDIASVQIGNQPRLGKVGWRLGSTVPDKDVDDAVEGIILLRRGENPDPVLKAINEKITELNGGQLPKGVKIVPFIDRTDLVHVTTHTVKKNLIEGILLVIFVLFLFLGNVRAATITALTIPFSLLFAFSCMNLIHVPANLISLGAVDFGILVNGSVIMVENIYRRLAARNEGESTIHCILGATGEVQSEIAFTTLIIIMAYLPLMTMQSVEKKMFAPMAYTLGFALVGSLLMALLIAPILCALTLRGRVVDRERTAGLKELYGRALGWALEHGSAVLSVGCGLIVVSIILGSRLGTEFLPHMDEGNLWIRASMPPTISYSEAARLMPKLRDIMSGYQPVRLVVSHLGRPDDGTDATGFYNAEFLVDLLPRDKWHGYRSKDELVDKMNAELSQIPGISFNFSQNIEDNVEEAVTGVKGELAVKLMGDDLDVLDKKAEEIRKVMSGVPGVVDLAVFKELGEPQVQIRVDRDKIARFGLNVQDVQDVVETAIGGKATTQLLEGEKKFDVVTRFSPESRRDIEEIRDIEVSTPDGQRIPLAQLADIRTERGAAFIYRESNRRFIAVKFGVRDRDIGSTVHEAQERVRRAVSLPHGYAITWGGEFESMQRANSRLMLIIPATLLLIFLILFALFNAASRAAIVMMNVPLAIIGGVLALYMAHFHLSVSSAVGFIALSGVAVQNGVIMVAYLDQLRAKGTEMREAVIEGAKTRLRPVLMTALLATIGLVPAAISTGIGSDIQKPLAITIIGGLVADVLMGTLFILPVLYSLLAKPVLDTEAELKSL
jgi:cobalt-zinc-cadmium resistance protein CzcA